MSDADASAYFERNTEWAKKVRTDFGAGWKNFSIISRRTETKRTKRNGAHEIFEEDRNHDADHVEFARMAPMAPVSWLQVHQQLGQQRIARRTSVICVYPVCPDNLNLKLTA
ncbi:hypothetical protein V9T40_000690 [Parthenolecanium corni]|uniref:Uncharacterized protein n=1 Tax=Parthenolecanium corni TaxID=536013 RepID=A0AAN9Y0M6_9HEMI